MTGEGPWQFPLADILGALESAADGARVRYAVRHGTMRAGVYAPRGADPQGPHDQDELYIVASGSGAFVKNGMRRRFAPGDLIFVEAGATHRFEDFGDDFVAWVIFWGAKGGETSTPAAAPGS
jgi:mannose-6-phosphate isomerase-like protein (cupin superfamily)